MPYYNLLGQPIKLTRDISLRSKNKSKNVKLALKFDYEYFDGDRSQGYGGYHYDGRWVPVAKKLIERYKLNSKSKFLDVGCAKGFLIYDLQNEIPSIETHGLDISRYAKEHAFKYIGERITLGSCEHIPFPDDYFDATVAINTIHNLNLESCTASIKEIMRVTKNKKNIFIQVDSYENEEEHKLFEQWMLTAKTYLMPHEWENIFKELNYEGDYFWTIIGFGK